MRYWTGLLLLTLSGSSIWALADAPFHIGVVTSSITQGEDSFRGAESLSRCGSRSPAVPPNLVQPLA
jgi:hypothetical protein